LRTPHLFTVRRSSRSRTESTAPNDSSCLGACKQSREAAINFMPVRLCAVHSGRIYVKSDIQFDIHVFYENMVKESKYG